eukprot:COSAG05_NODE_888_length_6737_cov_9.635583_6_plen_209_part_00
MRPVFTHKCSQLNRCGFLIAREQDPGTSDPTSLAMSGLSCDTMCVNGGLNTSWSTVMSQTLGMVCATAKDENNCLRDDDGKGKEKSPAYCAWKSNVCSYVPAEGDCMISIFDMSCGCPSLGKEDEGQDMPFKPKTCGPSTSCGRSMAKIKPSCWTEITKGDKDAPTMAGLRQMCGLPEYQDPVKSSRADNLVATVATCSVATVSLWLL